jgi:UDP-N-acetylmuramoyl-L-alanyl-D-glutamate--2,6-diaminopimelate ligase
MALMWTQLLDELRRSDLLVSAPASGPRPAGLSVDSRSIGPGAVYLAVRGSQADGHRFVPEAVRRGAGAVVVEAATGSGVPEIVVRDGRKAALVLGATPRDGSAWSVSPGPTARRPPPACSVTC